MLEQRFLVIDRRDSSCDNGKVIWHLVVLE